MLTLIKKLIMEFADVDEDAITEQSSFMGDLHLTSYDVVCLIGKLEENLGVEIPDREIRDITTVGELLDYLGKKMK
jgi:acyl carrier protein